jgi:ribosomal protein L11 methyltransferase
MNKNTITLNGFSFTIYNSDKVFGDGCHETTQGMLNLIASNDIKNKTILDLGTGSGILSIFAILSGASHVTAVDGDPYVFHFVEKNCEINQLNLSKIDCQFNYLTDNINTKFDIILSNLPDGPQTEAL